MRVRNVPPASPTRRHAAAAAALVVLAAAVFANTLPNTFHLDDFFRVVDNPGIQTVNPWWRHFADPRTMATLPTIVNYRPLLPLTLSLNYAAGGMNPAGYHVVHIALQAAAAVLAYFLFLALGASRGVGPWTALFAAAAFAVHPVSGIPVNYVSARDLLLMQVFLLASLLAYVRMRERGPDTPRGWAAALLLFLLALLSKTGVIVLPGIVLAYEWTVRGAGPRRLGPWLRTLPFLALGAAFLAYVSLVLHHSEVGIVRNTGVTALAYAATQLKLHLFHYLRNFAWPFPIRQAPLVGQAAFSDPAVWVGAAFVAATLVAAWLARRVLPVVSFAILAYWILLIPEASVFPLWALATDYRTYASSPFLFVAIAAAAVHFVPARKALAWVGGAVVCYFGAASVYLDTTWRTELSLWTHSVRHGGEALAHLNLGMSLADPKARAAELREAIRLKSDYVVAHVDLGLALIELGRRDEGLDELLLARKLNPGSGQVRYWLAEGYRKLGRPADEAREAAEAARLDPRNVKYAYRAGHTAQARGDWATAITRLKALAKQDPPHLDSAFLYGFALQKSGRTAEAMASYRRQLAVDPAHVQTRFNLAYALMDSGDCAAAVAEFDEVLRRRPSYDEVHMHLATCLEKLGHSDRAAEHRLVWDRSRSGGK